MKNLDFLGFDKYAASPCGKIYSIRSGRFLKSHESKRTGYLTVTLAQDGKRETWLVHRAIAMAFHDNPENLPCVNHKNGIKTDNSVGNLEWMSYLDNMRHAIETGLKVTANYREDRMLSDETAHKVCQLISDSWRNKDIASALGINQQIVANIRSGKDYNDISSEYDFENTLPSRRKLSTEKLIKICEMLEQGIPYSGILKEVHCSLATISNIKNRKHGTYISNNYKF